MICGKYNSALAKRFVSDYNLPIANTKETWFDYYLSLYESRYGSMTKWKELWKLIDERFEGSEGKFLDYYYEVRENIIRTISSMDVYREFNVMDMKQFEVMDRPKVSSGNVYNEGNVDKSFLSVDMRKANFQALKYVNPDIVFGCDDYEDFIGKFTDVDYMKKSKYLRQVIFGQLNPKRHITVEKYIVNMLWNKYKEDGRFPTNLVTMSSDEFVVELNGNENCCELKSEVEKVLSDTGIDVRATCYVLGGYQLLSGPNERVRTNFYVRRNMEKLDMEFACVPGQYHAMVYKLYHGIPLEEGDRHFVYEGIDCRFEEEFSIKPIEKGENA